MRASLIFNVTPRVLDAEQRSAEVLFWRNMYTELHAHTQELLAQNAPIVVDPLLPSSSSGIVTIPGASIIPVEAAERNVRGTCSQTPSVKIRSISVIREKVQVDDLRREILSLRNTLESVQQAKVDTEVAWGCVSRVEAHIDKAWSVL